MSVINNELYNKAAAGYTPLNGMYVFYGTPVSVTSGASMAQIISAISAASGSAGLARCHGLTSSVESGATIISGALISGTVTYITTTANAETVAGISITPGMSLNAIGLANLQPNIYSTNGVIQSSGFLNDTLLDSSTVSGGIVFPAGGYVTLVDKITVSSGASI